MTHMAVALRDPINCAVVITQLVVGAGLSLLLTMHMDKWGAWLHSMSSRQREANAAVKQVSCQSTDSVMCWDHQRQGRVQELDCSDQQLWHKPVVCDENGTKVAVDAKELQGHQLTDSDLQRCHDSHTGCSFNDTAFALQPSVVEEVSIAASEAPLGADTVVQASGNCEETVRVVPLHSTAQSHDRTPLRDETGSSNEDGTTAAELTVHPQVSAQQQSTVVVKALGPTAASEWLQDTMACMTAAGTVGPASISYDNLVKCQNLLHWLDNQQHLPSFLKDVIATSVEKGVASGSTALSYTSMCSTLPVSLKVLHDPADFAQFSHQLQSTVASCLVGREHQLDSPRQLYSACVHGCVHLIGLILSKQPAQEHRTANISSPTVTPEPSSSCCAGGSSLTASALATAVSSRLLKGIAGVGDSAIRLCQLGQNIFVAEDDCFKGLKSGGDMKASATSSSTAGSSIAGGAGSSCQLRLCYVSPPCIAAGMRNSITLAVDNQPSTTVFTSSDNGDVGENSRTAAPGAQCPVQEGSVAVHRIQKSKDSWACSIRCAVHGFHGAGQEQQYMVYKGQQLRTLDKIGNLFALGNLVAIAVKLWDNDLQLGSTGAAVMLRMVVRLYVIIVTAQYLPMWIAPSWWTRHRERQLLVGQLISAAVFTASVATQSTRMLLHKWVDALFPRPAMRLLLGHVVVPAISQHRLWTHIPCAVSWLVQDVLLYALALTKPYPLHILLPALACCSLVGLLISVGGDAWMRRKFMRHLQRQQPRMVVNYTLIVSQQGAVVLDHKSTLHNEGIHELR
eukprot:jgi/Chrzof1/10558/Cz05g03110.t1